jgi:hypothetical protein
LLTYHFFLAGVVIIIMPPVLSKEEFSATDLKALRTLYWTLQNEAEKKWKCSQCPTIRVKGNGWTNLDSHIFDKHADCKERLAEFQKSNHKGISSFFTTASEDGKNLHDWIEWMVMNDESPTFCENKYVRQNTKLKGVTTETLLKYAYKVNEIVKDSISDELPETFGLIFDGWSMAGEHYIAIFATWVNAKGYVVKRLLSCGVQDLPDEELGEDAEDFGFSADDIGDYLFDVVDSYGKGFDSIEFLAGDNAYVNGALCDKLQAWLLANKGITRVIPLVGCACHRLNLAIKQLYKTGTRNSELVKKVHNLMVELSTLKNSFKLNAKTSLRPVTEQDTRWGSTYHMLLKYLKLLPFLPQCAFSDATKAFFLTEDEDEDIRLLCNQLQEVEIRSKFLQGDYCDVDEDDDDAETKKEKADARDAKKKRTPLTLLSSRIVFDQLLDLFPSMKSHLAGDAPIVHNRDFENAVIKIQTNKEDKLTPLEKRAVKVFLLAPNVEEDVGEENFTEMMARLEEEAKAPKGKSKYRSLAHISPTSVVVERLFSRAKLIMTPHRRCMDPSTLEMLLLLRYNKDLWDPFTLDAVKTAFIAEREARKRAREEQARAREEAVRARLAEEAKAAEESE